MLTETENMLYFYVNFYFQIQTSLYEPTGITGTKSAAQCM